MKKPLKIFLAAAIISTLSFQHSTVQAQDAEYQLIRQSYKANDDGTFDIRYRKEIKLLRNRAITAYADKGETFILYNPAIDELTINESYTLRPDGTRVQTPANAFVDQLPSECQDCGRFNGIRERAVIHTALEYNCIIVLDYTIHRKSNILSETIVMSQDCPVKKYEVIVDAPKDTASTVMVNLKDQKKKIKKVNDGHTAHFVATNLEQSFKEPYLPNKDVLYPIIYININNYLIPDLVYNLPLPEADNLLGELYDKDSMTYAKNIRDYVVDYVKTTDIPFSLLNYRATPARTTFLSSCGTHIDKSVLIANLLIQAGFKKVTTMGSGASFSLVENGKSLNYILSAYSKKEAHLVGTPVVEDVKPIDVTKVVPWQGEHIGNGYMQMALPKEKGSLNIKPALLTSDRKAPLKVDNCNEKYHYTIAPPRTPKRKLVGGPVDISYTKKGVGSIRISITQSEGSGIEVIRELTIDVENGIVTPKQYKAFRQLMQDWYKYSTITIR